MAASNEAGEYQRGQRPSARCVQGGARVIDDCERQILAGLTESDAVSLKNDLAAVIETDH
jgi:hypothetical protein